MSTPPSSSSSDTSSSTSSTTWLFLLVAAAAVLVGVTRARQKQNEQQQPLTEGLKVKFPSIKSITAPILAPLRKVQSGVESIPKSVTKVGNTIGREITSVEKNIVGEFRAIEGKIVGSFNAVFGYIARGIAFITNIPSCLLWYLLDALGYVLYAPIAFFVWVFSLKALENLAWSYLDAADGLVYRAVGVHPFHFSNEIRNKCYFANLKNEGGSLLAVAGGSGGPDGGVSLGDGSVDDTELLGYLVFGVLCCALVWSGVQGTTTT